MLQFVFRSNFSLSQKNHQIFILIFVSFFKLYAPFSIPFFFNKRLIAYRQKEPSLQTGNYRLVAADRQMLAYMRYAEGEKAFLVILNLSHQPCYFKSPNRLGGIIEIATSPELEGTKVTENICMAGDEGIIVKLEG